MIKATIFDCYGVLTAAGEANHDLLEFIKQELKPVHKVGMLSNSASDALSSIFDQAHLDLFDDIILSFQVGLAKPDAKIYQLALERLELQPSEAVFVDDISQYCDAARQVGMSAVVYQDAEQVKTELRRLLSSSNH